MRKLRKYGTALAIALALVAFCSTLVAFAAPQLVAQMRKMPGVTPLPTAVPTFSHVKLARSLPPLPPLPTGRGSIRRIKSATGACIVFSYNPSCLDGGSASHNYVVGQVVTWNSANLLATGNTKQDYVLTPGSGTPSAVGATYTGTTGVSESTTVSSAGVYILASLNTSTNNWEAIAYVLVGSATSIATYADGTLAMKAESFKKNSSGSTTIYISASGLTPQHTYALGVEEQLHGRCVFTAPISTQASSSTTLCNLSSSGLTGTNPTGGGVLTSNYSPTLATYPTLPQPGTYVATVYDQTAGTRVASKQFTVIDGRASATARVNLQFSNGRGTTSSSSVTRIAYNGTASSESDSSQTYMNLEFGASGLPVSTDSYSLVVSDPNGNVSKTFSNILSNSGLTTITPANNQWGLPTQSVPFEEAYPGSTWTGTIYDSTTSRLTAAQSFQVLGYSASVLFDSPSSSSLNVVNNSTSTGVGITFTNTSDLTFGANNGDPLTKFVVTNAGTNPTSMSLTPPSTGTLCTPTSSTPCTGTYSDTAGNAWTATLSCGSGCGTDTITLTPVSTSTVLLPGASVDVTGFTIVDNANACKNICTFNSSITAQDMIVNGGGTGSSGTSVANSISVQETPGGSGSTGTAAVILAGYYDSSSVYHSAQSAGYTPRFNQAIFENNQPFTNAASKVVLSYTVKNTSSHSIYAFDLAMPSAFNQSTVTLDSHSPTTGATVTANGYCDGIARNTVCVTYTVGGGASQTFYFAMTPPSASFSYTDIVGTIVHDSSGTPLTPLTAASSSNATFIGSPSTVDSTAIGAYSLSGSLMLGALTPSSVGTSTTNNLSFTVRNTLSGADPFPDEVDFVELQVPNQTYISVPTSCASLTVNTPGWSCIYANSGSGIPTTYAFGQCPQQVSPLPTVPATSTSYGSDSLPICPFALPNEPYSLTAGATLSVTIPTTSGATATSTPVTLSAWAHGATTNGWTTPITSTIAVTQSATAGVGFSAISQNTTGTPSTIATGTEPQIVGNFVSGSPNYNTYVYKVRNTGNVAITSIAITIPGQDSTGSNGADSSSNIWKVLGTTSSITLTNETTGNSNGCSVSTLQNPTSGTDTTGNITIACPSTGLTSSQTLDVQFNALAPLKVNSTYVFPATINGSTTAASNNWFADTSVLIALSANVSVLVNQSGYSCTVPGGNGTPIFSSSASTIAFGAVNNSTTTSCKDAMIASVTTDASSPAGWALYVSTDANPTRYGGGLANEMAVETDSASSTPVTGSSGVPCPGSVVQPCFAYDNTAAYTALGLTSSGTGTRLGYTTNGGTGVDSSAINIYVNLEISIGTTDTIPTSGYTQTLTYTWISN